MNLKKKACFLRDGKHYFFTYFLLFGLLLSSGFVHGQTMSITAPDPTGAESGANNTIRFRIAKSTSDFAVPNYIVAYTLLTGAGTTTNGDDHTSLTGSVEIDGGTNATAVNIVIEVNDDDLVEGSETLTLVLEEANAGDPDYEIAPGADSATATVIDDDSGTVSVAVSDADASEEVAPDTNRGVFRITLSNPNGSSTPVRVNFEITGTANSEEPDADIGPITLFRNFTVNSNPVRSVIVNVIDDQIAEMGETVILTLTSITNGPDYSIDGTADSASITILDNDCPAGDAPPDLEDDSAAFCNVDDVNLNDFFEGSAPTGAPLRWSEVADPTANSDLLSSAEAANASEGTYYAVFWSNASQCASPATELVIAINETPDAGTAVQGLFSCNTSTNGGDTTFDLDTALNEADPGGDWSFVSAPAGGTVVTINSANVVNFNNNAAGDYVFRYTLTAVAPCEDQTVDVTIAVSDCDPCAAGNAPPELDPTVRTVFCDEIDVSLNEYTDASQAPSGTRLTWSTSSNLTNQNAHLNDAQIAEPLAGTYYGFFFDETNNCASPALTITLTLNMAPSITDSTGDTRCGPGRVTLAAEASGNPTFNWFTAEIGGSLAGTGEVFQPTINQTTTYFLEATENGCRTSPRIAVTAVVQPQPSAGIPNNSSSCNDPEFAPGGITTVDLDNLLTDEGQGTWVFTSGPVDVPRNNQNVVDFNGRPDGTYVYTFTTNTAQPPCMEESASVSISVSSCDTDEDGDGLLGGVEAGLGTDPNNPDTDGDLIPDDVEVGPDIDNPLDEDGDGIIDALDSNIADSDNDGVVDQLDPENDNACVPDITNSLCDDPIDIAVLKEVDNSNAVVDDEITFTVTVTNFGPRPAENIVIGEFLESGFEYVSDIPSSGAYTLETGQWQLENLAVDASATLQLRVLVVADENEMYGNTAELLSSKPLDNNPDNNISVIMLGVDQPEEPEEINLVIEKSARLEPGTQKLQNLTGLINDIEPKLAVEYFIKVVNKSEDGVVPNIRVEDVFSTDQGVEFEIDQESINAPEGSTFNANSGVWNISRALGVDEEIELSYTVVFGSVGTVINTAQITAPQENASNSDDSTSSVMVEITTRNELEVGILYNQFSPNSDGMNDVLKVNRIRKNELGLDVPVDINYDIEIYNRYGNLVYEAMNLTDEEAWDGTWKGKQVPDGTYFYALNVTIDIDGERSAQNSKGWIQLIR